MNKFNLLFLLRARILNNLGTRTNEKEAGFVERTWNQYACGEKCNSLVKIILGIVFQAIPQLEKQLAILIDVIRVESPDVKRVTNILTICTEMEAHRNRSMLYEVHKLLGLFLTIPVTSSLSERSLSAMRRLFTYLRSSMTESRFNNCFILHVHDE